MKFKVGQIWETRGGEIATVTSNSNSSLDNYPVNASINGEVRSYTSTGKYWHDRYENDILDLIKLIKDAGETQDYSIILMSLAKGEQVQWFTDLKLVNGNIEGSWKDFTFNETIEYISKGFESWRLRVKPETVMINGVECPKPNNNWVGCEYAVSVTIEDKHLDDIEFKRYIYKTFADAEQVYNALTKDFK